jgi:hypothetical protein
MHAFPRFRKVLIKKGGYTSKIARLHEHSKASKKFIGIADIMSINYLTSLPDIFHILGIACSPSEAQESFSTLEHLTADFVRIRN